MNLKESIHIIFRVSSYSLIFIGLLIIAILTGAGVTENLANGNINKLVSYVFPLFLITAIFLSVYLTILLIYTSIEVIYHALGLPPIRFKIIGEVITARIIEVIPTEKEEWKGIMSELKYGWKILGMTDKQIHRQEVILSISLAWGKVESWIQSVWIWIVQYF